MVIILCLQEMKRHSEAVGYFQQASELQHKTPLIALNSMKLAARCKLNMGDYDGALALLTEMVYLIHERGNQQPPLQKPPLQPCRIMEDLIQDPIRSFIS